jgi:hypothetical protein
MSTLICGMYSVMDVCINQFVCEIEYGYLYFYTHNVASSKIKKHNSTSSASTFTKPKEDSSKQRNAEGLVYLVDNIQE